MFVLDTKSTIPHATLRHRTVQRRSMLAPATAARASGSNARLVAGMLLLIRAERHL